MASRTTKSASPARSVDGFAVIQAIAYYGKLAIHPVPLVSLADLWERAAIGPIPGGVVVIAGLLFHGSWVAFAFATLRIEIVARRERRSLIAMG